MKLIKSYQIRKSSGELVDGIYRFIHDAEKIAGEVGGTVEELIRSEKQMREINLICLHQNTTPLPDDNGPDRKGCNDCKEII